MKRRVKFNIPRHCVNQNVKVVFNLKCKGQFEIGMYRRFKHGQLMDILKQEVERAFASLSSKDILKLSFEGHFNIEV